MTMSCKPEESRAIAIAGMVLGYALTGMLKRTGVLHPTAIDNTFEAALSSLETSLSSDDEAAALARQLLDLMGGQLSAHVEPLGSPSERDERQSRRSYSASSELATSRTD